jgi:hypothetical protein
MLKDNLKRTKKHSNQETTTSLSTHLFVRAMGGQMSSKAKTVPDSSCAKDSNSFSCSCSLVPNDIKLINYETIQSDSSKRRRKATECDQKNPVVTKAQIPRKRLKISMLYDDYETRNSYMAAFFKLLGTYLFISNIF